MSEPILFKLARQYAAQNGVPFSVVEADLYGPTDAPPPARTSKALVKNAVFAATPEPRVSPLKGHSLHYERLLAWIDELCPITEEIREQHEYEFAERTSVYVYEGLPERCGSKVYDGGECCAYHVVLSDVGCVEFFAKAGSMPFERGLVRPVPLPAAVGHCSRCESVGHVVSSCPFPVSNEVMRAAALRHDHRARKGVAA